MNTWIARSPSNIALVKYMGKADAGANLPANPSLSMTLDELCSIVEIREVTRACGIVLVNESPRGFERFTPPLLSESGQTKFIRHAERAYRSAQDLFAEFNLGTSPRPDLEIRSINTFPHGAGIASSASSFSALTLAMMASQASDPDRFLNRFREDPIFQSRLASFSRLGSGSSLRSWWGPWTAWVGREGKPVEASPGLAPRVDLVLVVDGSEKTRSSSQIHLDVMQSPLWDGRVERARGRFHTVSHALKLGDEKTIALEVWREAWEMHSLFHTLPKPFTYWKPETLRILEFLSPWIETEECPWVTLDAGPNIHLIVRSHETARWKQRILDAFPSLQILEDRAGSGPQIEFSRGPI